MPDSFFLFVEVYLFMVLVLLEDLLFPLLPQRLSDTLLSCIILIVGT
jgi:hypothetical protein